MSRRITTSLVALGLLGAFGVTTFSSAAYAVLPTRSSINALIAQDKGLEAESAYIEWSNGWQEEDPALLAAIESRVLTTMANAGDKAAFVALVQSGDPTALNTLRSMIATAKTDLTNEQLAAAIPALGLYSRAGTDLQLLTSLALSKNAVIADAAIKGLGNFNSPQALPALYLAASEGSIAQGLAVARAMVKMNAADLLEARYLAQKDVPLKGRPERAALMLAVSGNAEGWSLIKKILDTKGNTYFVNDPDVKLPGNPYYPAALSALGSIPVKEAAAYVEAGLAGTEEEQLAALQSIDALPVDTIESTLNAIIVDQNAPMRVRLLAVDQLTARCSQSACDALFALLGNTNVDNTVKAAAILGLQENGALANARIRKNIFTLVSDPEPSIALAARTALMAYAQR